MMNSITPQRSEWAFEKPSTVARRNSAIFRRENQLTTNETLIDIKEIKSQEKSNTRSLSQVKTELAPSSLTAFLRGLILGTLVAGLVLAVVITLWLTSPRQTTTSTKRPDSTALNIVVSTNATATLSTVTTTSITTATSIITSTTVTTSTTATTISTATTSTTVTTITTVTTSTTSVPTTSNICTGGTTYTKQLLYLNLTTSLSWTQYVFNYTAPNVNTAKIIFALQNDPDYWYLDDVSIKNISGVELLTNGDFELGDLTGWSYCNPKNASNAGTVSGTNPRLALYSYEDGSVGSSDYSSQSFTVQSNKTVTVRFWLQSISTNGTFASVFITA